MKTWRYLLVFGLSIILFSMTAYGKKNMDPGAATAGAPAVAVNKDGVVLVVWVRNTNKDNNAGQLYYDVFKNGQWAGPKNAGITRALAWTPQLDVDSEGNFHIAYPDGTSRLSREIFHSVYNPVTGSWSQESMIWLSPENSGWARIHVSDDVIYIVWYHEHVDPYQGSDIVMQSKGIHDQSWPSLYERISYTANNLGSHPAFKVKDGRVHVCYMEGSPLTLPWRIFYKEADQGSNWMNVARHQLADTGYYPELEVDDDGDVHVVWSNKNGNLSYRERHNGSWRVTEVISSRYALHQFPDIRYKNNILVAAWAQNDGQGGVSCHYARKFLDGKWEEPVVVANGSQAYACKVWLDDFGYAHFVWAENYNTVYYEKLAVPIPGPFLQLDKTSLSYTVEGKNPDPATVVLKNIGENPLNFTVKSQMDWISVSPVSGNLKQDDEQELTVYVDAFNLDEGSHVGTVEISSKEAINSPIQLTVELDVLAPPIFPPANFAGEVLVNKSLFYREYIHKLTWDSNPQNRNIEKYLIYEVDGVNTIFLEELPSTVFEYTRRHTDRAKTYTYELWAVDNKGRTGNDPATLTLGAASTVKKEEKDSQTTSIKSLVIK
jgi:hypothetical protein